MSLEERILLILLVFQVKDFKLGNSIVIITNREYARLENVSKADLSELSWDSSSFLSWIWSKLQIQKTDIFINLPYKKHNHIVPIE